MIKKVIISSVGAMLVAGFVLGRDVVSYVATCYHRVGDKVERSVPVEFQIERARQMVDSLGPEIRDSMHLIAKQEIELEQLNEKIANAENKSNKDKDDILRLQSDLKSNRNLFQYAGLSYSKSEVQDDLSRRFTRFKVNDETLSHLTKMRDARRNHLNAARDKFAALVSAKSQLEADVTNLEAKREMVHVAQASSSFVFDDSRLARAKELITDVRTRLDVAAKLADIDTVYPTEIRLDGTSSSDISDQVAEYFQLDAPDHSEVEMASYTTD